MDKQSQIVLATANRHKREELFSVLGDMSVDWLTLDSFPEIDHIEETGKTLEDNSRIKARTVHKITGLPSLADDTGLEVDALEGAPGVNSARYAGENVSFVENVRKLLQELNGIPKKQRTAQFRSVMTFVWEEGELSTEGMIQGLITDENRGTGGFGYDPVFYIPSMQKTFAEMTLEEKNKISHRGLAIQKMRHFLSNWLALQPQPQS